MSASVFRPAAAAIAAISAIAVPTIAGAKKPPVVIVPASTIADPAAKVCMPRATSPLAAKDKTLPDTLCETVEGWGARGVTVRTK